MKISLSDLSALLVKVRVIPKSNISLVVLWEHCVSSTALLASYDIKSTRGVGHTSRERNGP